MKKLLILLLMTSSFVSCKYTESPSAALAKEMCSCVFISGQTEQYCRSVTKEARILAKFEVDWNRLEVVSRGSNFRSVARLDDNPRYGCSIQVIEVDPEAGAHHDRNDR